MSITNDIALVFSPGWSHRIAREVVHQFPDRSILFTLSKEELLACLPRFSIWVNRFVHWRNIQENERFQSVLEKEQLICIGRDDLQYPELLQHIHEPPLILFVQGTLPSPPKFCAIVGSRKGTAYGTTQAFRFGKEVAEHNVGVISGLAYGVDEYAIRGACGANGQVIAVLAGGHASLGSREQKLRDLILEKGGAIISEQIPTTKPDDYLFPIRNRIIAGIAERTLVVEGAIQSGSLITARESIRENREVFALPGPITSPTSEGCNLLIKDGAGLCASIYDLLGITPPPPPNFPQPPSQSPTSPTPIPSIPTLPQEIPSIPPIPLPTPLHEKLWAFLQQPRMFDSLVEYAQEKGAEVAGILNIWEIEGYLALKNGHYSLVPYEHPPHC